MLCRYLNNKPTYIFDNINSLNVLNGHHTSFIAVYLGHPHFLFFQSFEDMGMVILHTGICVIIHKMAPQLWHKKYTFTLRLCTFQT